MISVFLCLAGVGLGSAVLGFVLGMRIAIRTMADDIDRVLGRAALEKLVEEVERQ